MCGIVGYIGKREACDILLEGLKRLEYRGYDSAGIAVVDSGKLSVYRSPGKLEQLEHSLNGNKLKGQLGIGHTRWATHGKPCQENAHPHRDCKGDLVVVHNGIIENYPVLKAQLLSQGHKFESETDTEVLAHLIESCDKGDLAQAVRDALKSVHGSYALGVVSVKYPGLIVAARKECPLVVGLGEGENFLASDIPPLLPYTRRVIILEDDEMIVITKDSVQITDKSGKSLSKSPLNITWDRLAAEKAGYTHFMLKEIHEQPQTIQDTLRSRVFLDGARIALEELHMSDTDLSNIRRVTILGCGTSYHAGLVGRIYLEQLAKIPCDVEVASEFRYRDPLVGEGTLAIPISQSGETADTLAALKLAKSKGATILGICNVLGSTLTRESQGILYTYCGPEIGVASTKAFTAQLVSLYMLALYLGTKQSQIPQEQLKSLIQDLVHLPTVVQDTISAVSKPVEELAKGFFKKTNFLYLGRHLNYPVAMEGALKLKEVSYIHAEGYPAGEMKHGPIALIDEEMPIVVVATPSHVYDKILSNMEEVKARGGTVIAVAVQGDKTIERVAHHTIYVPKVSEWLMPVLTTIPLQLLAYHIARLRGCDVDQPRNLAKSVTVE